MFELNLPRTLTSEEQEMLLDKYKQSKDKETRDKIILHNLKLVRYLANRMIKDSTPGREADDLFQEGTLGLMKALETYDKERGTFSNHASIHITGAIYRYLHDKDGVIRIPGQTKQEISLIKRTVDKLRQELSREPNHSEIADATDIKKERVSFLLSTSQKVGSLDKEVGEDNASLMELIEDEDSDFQDEVCGSELVVDFLERSKTFLKPDEYEVIRLNLGLDCGEHSFPQIAQIIEKEPAAVAAINQSGIWAIRRSGYVARLKRELDDLTCWYRSPRYNKEGIKAYSENSPVERIVLERESTLSMLRRNIKEDNFKEE